jgi:hypothetical protein
VLTSALCLLRFELRVGALDWGGCYRQRASPHNELVDSKKLWYTLLAACEVDEAFTIAQVIVSSIVAMHCRRGDP